MHFNQLYISRDGRGNIYAVGDIECHHCKNNIENNGILVTIFNRRGINNFFFHTINCIKYAKNMYGVWESSTQRFIAIPILITEEKPKNVRYFIPEPPEYKYHSKGYSVFDVDKLVSEGEDQDLTKLAGRETIGGAKIGMVDINLLEEKDKPIDDVKEVKSILLELAKSTDKYIDKLNKKMLE